MECTALGRAWPRWSPVHRGAALGRGAVPQIEIDQGLVRHIKFVGKRTEILDRCSIEANRDGLLQPLGVRVSLALGKVVFLSHRFHRASYWARSDRVARRAEMTRIASPSPSQWT